MRHAAALYLAPLLLLSAVPARARVYLTQEQAIEEAFPKPAQVERRTLFLDDDQARRVAREAGGPFETRVVVYYFGTREGRVTGYAYFDTHLVRTLPETVMVLLDPAGRIARIDILSFDEPEDYRPTDRWLQQFPGRTLSDDLSMKGGIRTLTGATLSARAITQAARRVLALHRLLVSPAPGGADKGAAGPGGAAGERP